MGAKLAAFAVVVTLLSSCKDKSDGEPKATALDPRVAKLEESVAKLEDAGRAPPSTLPTSPDADGGRCSEDAIRAAALEGRTADVKHCILPRLHPASSDELRLLRAACTIPLDQPCLDEVRRAEAKPSAHDSMVF
jgi:hypothetical protein